MSVYRLVSTLTNVIAKVYDREIISYVTLVNSLNPLTLSAFMQVT